MRAEPGVDHPLLRSAQYADLTVDPTRARAALVAALRRVDAGGGWGWPDDRSPFPGLRPFDVQDHRVFFGRSGEVEKLAGLLRSPAERAEGTVLVVVGPSGCGKSSLVRAGLLHVMADEVDWLTLAPMLPGADPGAALVRELAAAARQVGLDWTVSQVRHRLDATGLTWLADELLLRPALGGPVQVVATLRPEFLDQLLLDADLAVLPTRPYPLRPLRRESLPAVIQGPARLAGITVADELVARVVADTEGGEALPLLAFTLAQIADGVGRGGQLSDTRYEQLGGVQGALTRQADAALAEASAATGRRREQVIAGLLRLVTVDEQGRPTRWRVPRDDLPEPITRELDAFVRRRLLTTDTDQDRVVLGVAHEAFLSAWPPLVQVIEKNVAALRARRAVEQAATDWNTEGHPPARLWERGQLAAAVADTGTHLRAHDLITERVELSPTARAFLRASIHRDRFRRGRTLTVLSVLLAVAVVAAGYAFIQQRSAVQQRNVAVSRQIAAEATELRAPNPALAAQLALAGYRLASTTEVRSSLLSTFADPYATRLIGHTGKINWVAFSPGGHTLATGSGDATARLWDVSDPHQPHPLSTLTGHTGAVSSVVFSPDGHTLATGSNDATVRLWELPGTILAGHTNIVSSVAFSPDGHTLATASYDNTARLWDVSDPHQPHPLSTLTGHTHYVDSVAFSPDGHTLATGSDDTTARLWDANVESVAARICAITWPAITKNEWNRYLPGLAYRPPCP